MPNITEAHEILQHATPVLHQRGHHTQLYGHLVKRPIALDESRCRKSVVAEHVVDTPDLGILPDVRWSAG